MKSHLYILVISFWIIVSFSCTTQLKTSGAKSVHNKAYNQVNKLVKENKKVFYYLPDANYAYVWVHKEGYLHCYELFSNKVLEHRIYFGNDYIEEDCANDFGGTKTPLALDGGVLLGIAYLDNNRQIDKHIYVNLQYFIKSELLDNSCLEKQIQHDLLLIFSYRGLEEFIFDEE